uniref:Uncharacterized protein n=1 Tax=Anopheles dirus TaxID=7168 RepID=A0A182NVY7_9DIPT
VERSPPAAPCLRHPRQPISPPHLRWPWRWLLPCPDALFRLLLDAHELESDSAGPRRMLTSWSQTRRGLAAFTLEIFSHLRQRGLIHSLVVLLRVFLS